MVVKDLTKATDGVIIHHTVGKVNLMSAKYEIGQMVTITPVSKQSLSTRDADLHQYADLTGEITNYHWIRPPTGEIFYLYTVKIGSRYKEIVLYEDEIKLVLSPKSNRRSLRAK